MTTPSHVGKILKLIRERDVVTTLEVSETLGISYKVAFNRMGWLLQKGHVDYLKLDGPGMYSLRKK